MGYGCCINAGAICRAAVSIQVRILLMCTWCMKQEFQFRDLIVQTMQWLLDTLVPYAV